MENPTAEFKRQDLNSFEKEKEKQQTKDVFKQHLKYQSQTNISRGGLGLDDINLKITASNDKFPRRFEFSNVVSF